MNTLSTSQKYGLAILPFLAAWSFDFLFYDKPWGINFPIFIAFLVAVGLGFAALNQVRPNSKSLWLLIPILLFPIASVFRSDPITLVFNVFITWVSLVALVLTFRGGRWAEYSISDLLEKLLHYVLYLFTKPFGLLTGSNSGNPSPRESTGKSTWIAILRGLLLALPIIILLGGLLASADAVFEENLKNFYAFFNWENLIEFILRSMLVLGLTIFIAITYFFAVERSNDGQLFGLEKQGIARFLGQIEANVVLLLVNLLFLFFVVIQFQYLFGGETNIHLDGYTYAEYARRGFGELIAVAIVSLVILQVIHSIVRRENQSQSRVQIVLSVLIFIQLLVILASAYQRLNLYESAYGFSRLRTYSHVFLVWLVLLLLALAIFEVRRLSRYFPLALYLTALGIGATINFMGVDVRIAEWNINRSISSNKLDIAYLSTLSYDALPVLTQKYQSTELSQTQHDQIGAAIACMTENLNDQPDQSLFWQGFSFSRLQGESALDQVTSQIDNYQRLTDENYLRYVELNGQRFDCDVTNPD
ncbi:MAG TPA: DUF4173 domain-containing protein [Anaerolineales bacterium]|nr:DUF4173 domain-containing protein [Anaerolineales bacterium]